MRNTWRRPWKLALVQRSRAGVMDEVWSQIAKWLRPPSSGNTHAFTGIESNPARASSVSVFPCTFPLCLNIKNENSRGECAAPSPLNRLQGEVRLMGPNTRLQGDQKSRGEPEKWESDSIRPGPGSSANLQKLWLLWHRYVMAVSVSLGDKGVYAFIRYVW